MIGEQLPQTPHSADTLISKSFDSLSPSRDRNQYRLKSL